MKLTYLLFFLAFSISYSQISITNVEKKEEPAIKPQPYDGLTNISQKKLKNNFDFYYGLNGFFVPYEAFDKSTRFYTEKPILNRWVNSEVEYNGYNFSLNSDEVKEKISNKRFKILEAIPGNDLKKLLIAKKDSIKKSGSKIELSSRNIYNELGSYDYIYLKIQNEETNEQFYFAPWGRIFILDDYINNLKNKYLGQSVRIIGKDSWLSDSRNKVKELTSGKMINVEPNSKWKVDNITFLNDLYDKCTLNNKNYKLCFLLTNDKVGKVGFEINVHSIYPTNRNKNLSCQVFSFLLEKDYQEKVKRDKLIIAQREKEKALEKKKLEKEKENRKQSLIANYGQTNGLLIFQNKVKIGMSKKMCLESWGQPLSKRNVITENNKMTLWIYHQNKRLYFKNDELVLIEY